MIRRRNYTSEKEKSDDSLSSFRFFVTLILLGLALAMYGFCVDKPDNTTGCVAGGIVWAVFWTIPCVLSWLELHRSKPE
jgi:hypothetical protein